MPNNTIISSLELYPAFETIGVIAKYDGDDNDNCMASLFYRPLGSSIWIPGMEMCMDRRWNITYYPGGGAADQAVPNPWARQARTVILGYNGSMLTPNTDYEVMVVFADPDGVVGIDGPDYITATVRTRDNNPPSNGRIISVSTLAEAQLAADDALPGDRIIFAPGVYAGQILVANKSGLPDNYITFESQSPLQATIDGLRTHYCGFRLTTCHYVRIKGFHLFEQAQYPVRIEIGSSYIFVEDCFADNGYWTGGSYPKGGIYVRGNSHHVTIQRNHVSRYRSGVHGECMGIFIEHSLDALATPYTGQIGCNVICDNEIDGDFRDGYATTGGYINSGDINIVVCRNYVHDIPDDDALELEGPMVNCVSFLNKSHRINTVNLGFAPVGIGPMYSIRDELVQSGNSIKVGSTSHGYLYIYHPTIYNPTGVGPATFGSNDRCYNHKYRNGIIVTSGCAMRYGGAGGNDTHDLDYDCYQSGDPGRLFRWYATYWASFAEFQATGQEPHGLYADPMWMSPDTYDFRLQAGSPCIGRGEVIQGINDIDSPWPYQGGAPDLGAIESGITGPPLAAFSAMPTSGDPPLEVQFIDESSGAIDSWSWDFGDGMMDFSQNPTHVYINPGIYTVTLTVSGPGGVSIPAELDIAVTAPPTTWDLIIGSTVGGTTNPAAGIYSYVEGTVVTITASPEPGYVFKRWEENDLWLDTLPTINIIMDADRDITAVFEPEVVQILTVTIMVVGQGTTDPLPGTYPATVGEEFAVTAIPADKYKFDHWEGTLGGTDNPKSFIVTSDMKLTAVFKSEAAGIGLPLAIGIGIILTIFLARRHP